MKWPDQQTGHNLRTTPITRDGVAAAVADGTLRIDGRGKLLFDSDAAERLASRANLLEAEVDRKAVATMVGSTTANASPFDVYRTGVSAGTAANDYWRLVAAACRSAARLGLDNAQIARWLGVPAAHVAKCWTPTPDTVQRQARRLLRDGYGLQHVSRQLGLHTDVCKKLATAEGLSPTNGTVPKHVLDAVDDLLTDHTAADTYRMVLARWPEMEGVLKIGNVRVRAVRLKRRSA